MQKKIFKKFRKTLIKLTYNPSRHPQEKFLEAMTYNLDYAFGQYNIAHILGDFYLYCLNKIEKNDLKSIITPYSLQFVEVLEPTRLAENSE